LPYKKKKLWRQRVFFLEEIEWRDSHDKIPFQELAISDIRFKFWISFFSFYIQRWILYLLRNFTRTSYKETKERTKHFYDASFLFFLALLKITPIFMLKPIYIGGVDYEMPFPLSFWKRISFGCRWVINLLKKKQRVISVKTVVDSLSSSIWDSGLSMEKKGEVYDLALLNRYLLRNKVMRR